MNKIKINYEDAKELLSRLGFELSLNTYDTLKNSKYVLMREKTKSNRLFILNTEDILKYPISIIDNSKLAIKKDSLDYILIKVGRTVLDFVQKNDLIEATYIDRRNQGFGCTNESQGVSFGTSHDGISFGTTYGMTEGASDNSKGSCGISYGEDNSKFYSYGTSYGVGCSWSPKIKLVSYIDGDTAFLQDDYVVRLNNITRIWIYDELIKDYILVYNVKK